MLKWTLFLLFSIASAIAHAQSVTVLVAASTQDAMREIAGKFSADSGIEVRVSPGASNALAQQIIQGAPADVFISASPQWTGELEKQSLVAQTRPLLGNELVVIQPSDATESILSPSDLLGNGFDHVALAGEKVPAGIYALQALTHHHIYDKLIEAGKIVRGQDVRATLAYVVRGEADAGIVYASDALVGGDKVKITYRFAPDSHEKIIYPASLLNTAKDNAAARRFFDHLSSAEASDLFRRHGFLPFAVESNP